MAKCHQPTTSQHVNVNYLGVNDSKKISRYKSCLFSYVIITVGFILGAFQIILVVVLMVLCNAKRKKKNIYTKGLFGTG